ncbi:hypothetical protein AMEJIAPC_03883 [Caulobacter sp. NIBR1757]|nr:hypothetical protein AMEJIAPC_03883 [Caulobacter sp. NIBR1757]
MPRRIFEIDRPELLGASDDIHRPGRHRRGRTTAVGGTGAEAGERIVAALTVGRPDIAGVALQIDGARRAVAKGRRPDALLDMVVGGGVANAAVGADRRIERLLPPTGFVRRRKVLERARPDDSRPALRARGGGPGRERRRGRQQGDAEKGRDKQQAAEPGRPARRPISKHGSPHALPCPNMGHRRPEIKLTIVLFLLPLEIDFRRGPRWAELSPALRA